ncbi:MAG: hypothetical protein WAQ27_02690 [Candidatus Microsaccharimonas sp.]
MNQHTNAILIIKVGTSTVTTRDQNGQLALDLESFQRIGQQVINLRQQGYTVAIVSSAAITAGMAATGLTVRPVNTEQSMPTLQALASIGWRYVLNAWADALGSLTIGELLVSRRELERDIERSELLRVTHSLMQSGTVAIINENDAIAHEEIAYGDNDTLAAHFAAKLKNSKLFSGSVSVVILSDIDGVYEDINDKATIIRHIHDIDASEAFAKGTDDGVGTGGMVTKFKAARIARDYGVDLYITQGRIAETIPRAVSREIGTYFG